MHIYFAGIGGVGLGPLAEIAYSAGHEISGSDLQVSPTFVQLQKKDFQVGISKSDEFIAAVHAKKKIAWLVYSSALPPDYPELEFAKAHHIKATKRDQLLKEIIHNGGQKLIAIAGTHGKTTTAAMVVWLFKQLGLPVSYSVGALLSWGPSGAFDETSEYFVYECDEFDRNFLHFQPDYSAITSIGYDHPDTYPTEADYQQAFGKFLDNSDWKIMWQEDIKRLQYKDKVHMDILEASNSLLDRIALAGPANRRNALLAIQTVWNCTKESTETLLRHISNFPGVKRRFEKMAENLYSDYAHQPEEIAATLELGRELSDNIIVVYEPHQNTRQHHLDYSDCFDKAEKIYWLPTYLSREDKDLAVLSPLELTKKIDQHKLVYSESNDVLWQNILYEKQAGKLVIIMGAGQIDAWARHNLRTISLG